MERVPDGIFREISIGILYSLLHACIAACVFTIVYKNYNYKKNYNAIEWAKKKILNDYNCIDLVIISAKNIQNKREIIIDKQCIEDFNKKYNEHCKIMKYNAIPASQHEEIRELFDAIDLYYKKAILFFNEECGDIKECRSNAVTILFLKALVNAAEQILDLIHSNDRDSSRAKGALMNARRIIESTM